MTENVNMFFEVCNQYSVIENNGARAEGCFTSGSVLDQERTLEMRNKG